MKIYKSLFNQSIFDICTSIYGNLNSLTKLMVNNPGINMIDYINPGTSILFEDNINPIGNFTTNNGVYNPLPKLPTITLNPLSPSVLCGFGPVTMTVDAIGIDLTYQWQYLNGSTWTNRNNISPSYYIYATGSIRDTNTNILTLENTPGNWSNIQYRCAVSNDGGTVYSTGATFTTINGYIFTQPPSGVDGTDPTFTIVASASVSGGIFENITWQYNTTGTANSGFLDIGNSFPGHPSVGISGTFSLLPTSSLSLTTVPFGGMNWYVRARVFYNCGFFYSDPSFIQYGTI